MWRSWGVLHCYLILSYTVLHCFLFVGSSGPQYATGRLATEGCGASLGLALKPWGP